MGVNQSQQAVAARIRARYGRFFTPEDYAALAACGGMPELLAALREREDFAAVLAETGATPHRDNIEQLLQYQFYEDLGSLFRFDRFLGSELYQIPAGYLAVDLLLSFARHYNAGTARQFAPRVPAFFREHISFDVAALAETDSLSDLVRLLAGHPLLPAVAENLPPAGAPIHLGRLEDSLLRVYYRQVTALFAKDPSQYRGGAQIFAMLVDVDNLQKALRCKQYFPQQAGGLVLSDRGTLSPKQLQQLQTMNYEQTLDFVKRSRYGAYVKADLPADVALESALYDHCRKIIRFRVEIPSLLIAYMLLSRTRLRCLTTVTEGVRYGMPPETILSLLPIGKAQTQTR